jgi:hypothetical protein
MAIIGANRVLITLGIIRIRGVKAEVEVRVILYI